MVVETLGLCGPDETELSNGTVKLNSYFDALEQLPSHTRFIQGKPASNIRKKDGEDNILFRPMAQIALAEAVATLEVENGMSLESIMSELARQEESGQLKLRDRMSPWFGVLCDRGGKMRRKKENQFLCTRLFRYLLGGGIADDEEREDLRKKFVEARRIDDNVAVNMDGKSVSENEVQLPSPWR